MEHFKGSDKLLPIVKHTKLVSDSRSVNLKNNRGNIQRKSGKALYNVAESLPGDWQTFSDNNIRYSSSSRKQNSGHCTILRVTLTALSSFSIHFADLFGSIIH